MKGRGGAIVLHLLLNACDSRALFLRPRFLSPTTGRMSTVRRRTGRGIVSSGDGETDHTRQDVGKLMWSNILRRKSNTRDDEIRNASSENAASSSSKVKAFPPSVIHLGKLRIPPSLRINLAWTRSTGGPEDDANSELSLLPRTVGPAVTGTVEEEAGIECGAGGLKEKDGHGSIHGNGHGDGHGDGDGKRGQGRAAAEKERDRERDKERERKIEIGEDLIAKRHSFVVGPSVIPYGVGKDESHRGVVQIPVHFTVGQSVEFIRQISAADRETGGTAATSPISDADKQVLGEEQLSGLLHEDKRVPSALTDRIYLTENGKLKGYITMSSLLTNASETPVLSLSRTFEELLREGDRWEDAAHRLRQAHVLAAPVVDDEGILVAVLNPNDLLREMEIEATDDIMRQSGSGRGESYFGTPLPRLVGSRVGWLLGLLCLQSLSSVILQRFQSVIERNMVIALFLTMLTGTAGNAGNQSSAMVIRGLATGEINKENRLRVVWRESRAAVASAAVLSAASFLRVLLTPGATIIATLAVSVAMGVTVVGAIMFGTVAPITLHGMGVDPVNFASPALATLTDVTGVFVLCFVAQLMLGSP